MEKTYEIKLTEAEMQSISHAMAAFFNRLADEKKSPSEYMATHIARALYKMKMACEAQTPSSIILPQ